MDFTILPYDRLPEFIRESVPLQQALLQSGGIMKYVAEHIDDPLDDDAPLLFVQYQNYVTENYRKACRWNPNRQSWSVEDLRQKALNGRNHLYSELQSRRVLMQTLRMLTGLPFGARNVVDVFNMKYLEYAWKEDLRRKLPNIETDLGTYRYVIQQFERFGSPMMGDGLACRSIDIALKTHHGYELTEIDDFDCLNIEMFHHYFFGPTIISRMQRGLAELLHGKNTKACRTEAMRMLNRVKWFSQHIYNDDVNGVHNDSFTLEDKRWLRSLVEHYNKDFSEDELNFFYFAALLADVGRLWEKQLRSYPDIDLSELEKEANSLVNTKPSIRQISWDDEKQCFKKAVLQVMKRKKDGGGDLFEKPTQWKAVYRFAVDMTIMYDINDNNESYDSDKPYKKFANFARELQLDDNSSIPIPFKKVYIEEMKKKNYARFNTCHPWSMDGIIHANSFILYTELDDVYKALEEEYNKLIMQAEMAID